MAAHSPVGGSAAPRFLKCPGSVGLVEAGVVMEDGTTAPIVDTTDDTFSAPGTRAHELAERVLKGEGEAWEYLAPPEVDREMVDAVTEYAECIRSYHGKRPGRVEHSFHCPTIHEQFFGTADFVYVKGKRIDVWDFKYGAGVVVDADHNEQLMYYACGVLESLHLWAEVDTVTVHIFQPRAYHWNGPHRHWTCTTDELARWMLGTLIPGMAEALGSNETHAGMHCRFCPVRFHKCPALMKVVDELEPLVNDATDENVGVSVMSNSDLCRLLDLGEIFKIARTAALKTATARAEQGHAIATEGSEGWKLVKARANRKFRDGAENAAIEEFGESRAYNKPTMKTPAQIDKMAGGRDFTAEWAFKPESGLTLVQGSEARPAVTKEKAKAAFQKRK